jgi:hypothetical protein
MTSQLVTVSALLEFLTGLALVLVPDTMIALLFGAKADPVSRMIARVCGVALISISIACWAARTGPDSRARLGTIRAITFYNLGAGLLLVASAATGKFHGIVIWSVGLLHLALAVAFIISRGSAEIGENGDQHRQITGEK